MNYRAAIGVFFLAFLTSTVEAEDRFLFRFDSPEASRQWRTVNDTVMGGRSIGQMKLVEDNRLQFSGTISTENNGGFAGVKAIGASPFGLKKGDVIVAKVRGDGRQYLLNLHYATDILGEGPVIKGRRRPDGYSYRQPFETKKDEWTEVQLPVDKFFTVWRGKRYPNEEFDPRKVGGMRFLVKSKPGPFKLEVEWIKVVEPPPQTTARVNEKVIVRNSKTRNAKTERAANSNESAITDDRVLRRSYTFEDGEEIPYAVFVPSNYDKSKSWPLMVALHGWGGHYDWAMGCDGMLEFSQRDGFIVVAPLGYVRDGWYGSRPDKPNAIKSEQDVMNVQELVRKEWNVDENRIYLWGYSMGGAGTYHLAAKYPDIWAGLGVAAPAPSVGPEQLEKFKDLPILVLQGDEDRLVKKTRKWVAKMKELGMQYDYVEVPGGGHRFISKNREMLDKFFQFFSVVKRQS